MAERKSAPPPVKWWQWVLMYPALIIALIGNIPNVLTLYKSFRIDVPFRDTDRALAQAKTLNTNGECLVGPFQAVPSSNKVSIFVKGCRTALLVYIQSTDPAVPSGWRAFSFAGIGGGSGQGNVPMMIRRGLAEESLAPLPIAQGAPKVICQKWLSDGSLLVRIQYPSGQCFDQTVNPYTGTIIRTVPAPVQRELSVTVLRMP